ncbi:histidine phosphatase family protein [Rhodovarius lipocyclicus]|uniref:histidine phosphatase family protein n=1 Tax=Rhodovarius lipocyclicus TaxID=268410 RepID=UPI00135BA29E|nr:histidine phosphatase family protein [Rhodovarius lipocyclicus]
MILLRHGQSEFNLHFTRTRVDPGIIDPKLTDLGHEQAERAAETLVSRDVRRILASPYTRALQTALPLARRLGLSIHVTPMVRERYAFTCDVGRPARMVAAEFPEVALDHIEDVWWPAEEEPEHGVVARARDFRAELAAREDWAHTVVVSHWGFILACTGRSLGNGEWLEMDPREPAPQELTWRHH